ncbi:hypothetical protein ACFV2V_13740 [Streptomyces sp. NPDC059698]|uniref:hypothetical protein n=1 Tax=unclassified Streptomyces TaxID=2593676 RepID=UPI00093D6F73|nr:hypothetical protein [Streptomyces sp. CB02366]OKJ38250.1 hypothetical protein AMK24_11400 [Streptomyces sp. CB02366]
MTYAMHATVALAPAEPGWSVTVTDLSDGDTIVCPVVAWASVVTGLDDTGATQTELFPAFFAHGRIWTSPEYPVGPDPVVVPPSS